MAIRITTDIGGQYSIDQYPDVCPFCHKGINVIVRNSIITENNDLMQIVLQCPINDCGRLFLGYYYNKIHFFNAPSGISYIFGGVLPLSFKAKEFDAVINDISPNFVEIYNQSLQAEEQGNSQICGIGYRKALEFLIKDYLIKTQHDKEQEIRQTERIGVCISKFVNDLNIKECAKRACKR